MALNFENKNLKSKEKKKRLVQIRASRLHSIDKNLSTRLNVSTTLLTPTMQALLKRIHRVKRPPLYLLNPVEARLAYEAMAEVLDRPKVALDHIQSFVIPTGPGVVCDARIYALKGEGSSMPTMLYFHGGGYTLGGLETHDSLCRQLALQSGVAIIALNYRLAPEHRFPAAVHDAMGALRWLYQGGAASLGLSAGNLSVGGDSAGATLAAVCAIMARDEGFGLKFQFLLTPGTAPNDAMASHRTFERGFLLERPLLEWFFRQYISPGDRSDWRFAPLLAPDLEGVAPAWIGLAECDPLVDEGLAYADRLRMAGVPTQIELWRGVTHDFIKMGRVLPEAVEAQATAAHALRQALMSRIPESSMTYGKK